MKPKTELLLYYLLWQGSRAFSPSLTSLTQTFEEWAYANRALDRLHELEALGFMERNPEPDASGACRRFTEAALRLAPTGRHPRNPWKRRWDRKWHMLLFDLPANESSTRKALHRGLRRQGFGCLQDSVWVHPVSGKPPRLLRQSLTGRPSDFMLLESRSRGKNTDRLMVMDAWNWNNIAQAYDQYRMHLDQCPLTESRCGPLLVWARKESGLWRKLMEQDPLLPEPLLPDGYEGKEVWTARRKLLKQVTVTVRNLFESSEN